LILGSGVHNLEEPQWDALRRAIPLSTHEHGSRSENHPPICSECFACFSHAIHDLAAETLAFRIRYAPYIVHRSFQDLPRRNGGYVHRLSLNRVGRTDAVAVFKFSVDRALRNWHACATGIQRTASTRGYDRNCFEVTVGIAPRQGSGKPPPTGDLPISQLAHVLISKPAGEKAVD
jgi:hypothetical protein